MYSDDVCILLIALFAPLILVFLSGINGFKRRERSIREFYYILREKYPRSYVQQNKILKFVRKCFGMEIKGTIHWITCFLHYFQIVFAISPIFMLIIFLVKQSEQVIYTFLAIGIALPFGLFYILMEIFTMLQVIRCKKIKKTIPRYSKSEIYRWNRP